jgi:hypothetical protein
MTMDASSFPLKHPAQPARLFLWMAVGLLVVSQFFGLITRHWIILVRMIWDGLPSNLLVWAPLWGLVVGMSSVAIVMVTPWMVGMLVQFRPWLWILRMLMTVAVLWKLWTVLNILVYYRIHHQPIPSQMGNYLLTAAIGMNVLGLWMIPRPRAKDRPEDARRGG